MTRRGFIKGLLGTILAGLFVSFYAFFIEPALRLRVKRWRIQRNDWTAPPLKVVLISDLHLGEPFVGIRRLRQIVRRTSALDPDLVLLLGDFAKGHHFITRAIPIEEAAPVLSQLKAKHGVWGVLGNHDWWDDLGAQKRKSGPNLYAQALAENGIPILSNEVRFLDDAGIYLAGLEDQLAVRDDRGRWTGLDDLPGTLAQIPDDGRPCIMMAHEPDIFAKIPDRVALTVSGHTHGGQVRLLGYSPIVPSAFGNRFAYGHIHDKGRDLVVSGGIGCSMIPVRFGVVPEITVVELSKG